MRSSVYPKNSPGMGRLAMATRISSRLAKECPKHRPPNCKTCKPKLDHLVDWMDGRSEPQQWLASILT